MKTIDQVCFQGDVCFRRVEAIPAQFVRVERKAEPLVVAHSETGHDHQIDDVGVVSFEAGDPLRCFLLLESVEHCDVVHHRPFDTHETIRLDGGAGSVFEVIRQREYTPEGWRRVED